MTTTTIKEGPILFSGPMVRAILEDRKTKTRRVVKPQPTHFHVFPKDANLPTEVRRIPCGSDESKAPSCTDEILCPYHQLDHLWVRETAWYDREAMLPTGPRVFYASGHVKLMRGGQYGWAVGGEVQSKAGHWEELLGMNSTLIKKPSIFMPRWASRLTLEVVGVRIERVQEISDADAEAEGMNPSDDAIKYNGGTAYRYEYAELWDKLNRERGFGWDKNPWVWVVEFKRVTKP